MNTYPIRHEEEQSSITRLQTRMNELGQDAVEGTNGAWVIEAQLRYGTVDPAPLLAHAETRFDTAATAMVEHVASYLRMGRVGHDVPADIIEKPSYNHHPKLGTERVSDWAEIVRKSNPAKTNAFAESLVTLVETEYDDDGYTTLVASTKSHGESKLAVAIKTAQQHTAAIIGYDVAHYATDPSVVTRFLESPMIKHITDPSLVLKLHVKVAELSGYRSDDGTITPAFQKVIDMTKPRLTNARYTIGAEYGIKAIVEHAPEVVPELIIAQGDVGHGYLYSSIAERLYKMPQDMRTGAHDTLQTDIEAKAAADFHDYYKVMSEKSKHAALSPVEARHLAALTHSAYANYGTYYKQNKQKTGWLYGEDFDKTLDAARTLISRNLANEDVKSAMEADAGLGSTRAARQILIRRLSRIGEIESAVALAEARPTTDDSTGKIAEPIMSFLALYDETGDENFLVRADEAMAYAQSQWHFNHVSSIADKIAITTYAAAIRHNNTERANDAFQKIVSNTVDLADWERQQSLKSAFRLFTEIGDLETARHIAEAHDAGKDPDAYDAYTLTISYIKALVDTGQSEIAAAYLDEKIESHATPTIPYTLVNAMKYILGTDADRSKISMPIIFESPIRAV